jgi:hypothetical protein
MQPPLQTQQPLEHKMRSTNRRRESPNKTYPMLSYLAIPFDRFNWSQGVKVKAQVIERFSLMEELWIVAKDDTPNTHSFVQVSQGLSVISLYLPFHLFDIHDIVLVTLYNQRVIRIIHDGAFKAYLWNPVWIFLHFNIRTGSSVILSI